MYGVETVSKKCVFKWLKCFRDGKEGVEDEPHSGRPSASITPDNIEQVLQKIIADRQMSLRMITGEIKIGKYSASFIVHKHLKNQKICIWFAPHMLTNE